jgi:multicomponent Na+:H+ antiporter subunit B
VRVRLLLLLASAVVLLPAVVVVAVRMPTFGDHPLPYGDAINREAPAERHVSNMVSAVNFDYRGFDTMGEEFMLVTAVTGAVLLLRGTRGESLTAQPQEVPGRPVEPASEAVVLICRLMMPISLLFGIYVVLHATATPGGGFQGGVIIASSLLLLYLGDGYRSWRGIVRSKALHLCEGGGALVFVLAGVGPMLTDSVSGFWNFLRKRGRQRGVAGDRSTALAVDLLAAGGRVVRNRHQPSLRPPDWMPDRRSVCHLCSAVGRWLSVGCGTADLL